MKLLFLIIFLCGITSAPKYTTKAIRKVAAVQPSKKTENLSIVPGGLLFQF